jgi:hypothetical protein
MVLRAFPYNEKPPTEVDGWKRTPVVRRPLGDEKKAVMRHAPESVTARTTPVNRV